MDVEQPIIQIQLGNNLLRTRLIDSDKSGGERFETADEWKDRLGRDLKLSGSLDGGLFAKLGQLLNVHEMQNVLESNPCVVDSLTAHSAKIPHWLNGFCICDGNEVYISEEVFHGTNPLKLQEMYNELIWLHFSNAKMKKKRFVFVFFDMANLYDWQVIRMRREWTPNRVCKLGNFKWCRASDLGYYFNFGGPIFLRDSKGCRRASFWNEIEANPGCDFLIKTVLMCLRRVKESNEVHLQGVVRFLVERDNPGMAEWSNPHFELLAAKKFHHHSDGGLDVMMSWAIWSQSDYPCKHGLYCEVDRFDHRLFPTGRIREFYDI